MSKRRSRPPRASPGTLGVGVHIHVAEGPSDAEAAQRLAGLTREDWLLAHCIHLADDHELAGTIQHNTRSNMNNAVGYARPYRFANPIVLGSDGIGAHMIEEFRLAYFKHREADVTATPETAWSWLQNGWDLVPEAREDVVTWSYAPMDPWHLAFTPGVRPLTVEIAGETVLRNGRPTRVDPVEVRAKAAEQARRLHSRL